MNLLSDSTVQKALLLLLGALAGTIAMLIGERIKRRYAKADEAADAEKRKQSERENVHLNVLRERGPNKSPFGPPFQNTWMITPGWLEKSASGDWRVREWEQFEVMQFQVRKDDYQECVPLTDEPVTNAKSNREWLVFIEYAAGNIDVPVKEGFSYFPNVAFAVPQILERPTLVYMESKPCGIEHAHLFDYGD